MKSDSFTQVTVVSPAILYPGVHFRETSCPGEMGKISSVVTISQLEGKLSHESKLGVCSGSTITSLSNGPDSGYFPDVTEHLNVLAELNVSKIAVFNVSLVICAPALNESFPSSTI